MFPRPPECRCSFVSPRKDVTCPKACQPKSPPSSLGRQSKHGRRASRQSKNGHECLRRLERTRAVTDARQGRRRRAARGAPTDGIQAPGTGCRDRAPVRPQRTGSRRTDRRRRTGESVSDRLPRASCLRAPWTTSRRPSRSGHSPAWYRHRPSMSRGSWSMPVTSACSWAAPHSPSTGSRSPTKCGPTQKVAPDVPCRTRWRVAATDCDMQRTVRWRPASIRCPDPDGEFDGGRDATPAVEDRHRDRRFAALEFVPRSRDLRQPDDREFLA